MQWADNRNPCRIVVADSPGAIVARSAQLTWPIAVAAGPALTYGVVALAIIPFGALGIVWNAWTALGALLVVTMVVAGLRVLLDPIATPTANPARSPAGRRSPWPPACCWERC
ncbi:conserved transmembrane domain protein [Mycobacterium xenopi 3993]|nr:conserved transmembrane domain protein [Mycobacterium xenopi 3993]